MKGHKKPTQSDFKGFEHNNAQGFDKEEISTKEKNLDDKEEK